MGAAFPFLSDRAAGESRRGGTGSEEEEEEDDVEFHDARSDCSFPQPREQQRLLRHRRHACHALLQRILLDVFPRVWLRRRQRLGTERHQFPIRPPSAREVAEPGNEVVWVEGSRGPIWDLPTPKVVLYIGIDIK